MKIGDTLKEAAKLVNGDRGRDYDDPHVCYSKAARILEVIAPHLRAKPSDIMLVFIAAKLARGSHRFKWDNVVDAVNFLDFYASMKEEEDAMQHSAKTATLKGCFGYSAEETLSTKEEEQLVTWDTTAGTIGVNLPAAKPGVTHTMRINPYNITVTCDPLADYEAKKAAAMKEVSDKAWEDWWSGPLCATPNVQGENPVPGSVFQLPAWTAGMTKDEITSLLNMGKHYADLHKKVSEQLEAGVAWLREQEELTDAPIETCTPQGPERSEEEPDYSIWLQRSEEGGGDYSLRVVRRDRSIEEGEERHSYFWAKAQLDSLFQEINSGAKETEDLAQTVFQIRYKGKQR